MAGMDPKACAVDRVLAGAGFEKNLECYGSTCSAVGTSLGKPGPVYLVFTYMAVLRQLAALCIEAIYGVEAFALQARHE